MPRAVVVPCYNEAARLDTGAFRKFARGGQPVRSLFVNDGSTDATRDVLDELRGINPACFDVLELPANVGKAEAVRRGVLHAVAARPDYVRFWDADLAAPLETITTFTTVLDRRSDLEMVIGARVCLLDRSVKR
jgi:glycosyltransferase involved in cell wall biosynthesis